MLKNGELKFTVIFYFEKLFMQKMENLPKYFLKFENYNFFKNHSKFKFCFHIINKFKELKYPIIFIILKSENFYFFFFSIKSEFKKYFRDKIY